MILFTPLPQRLLAYAGVAAVVGLIAAASVVRYAEVETVDGQIIPTSGIVRIVAQQPGTVEAIQVQEGTDLKAGAAILTVRLGSVTEAGDSGVVTGNVLTQELGAAKLQAQAEGQALDLRRDGLARQQSNLKRSRAEAEAKVSILMRKLTLAEQNVARGRALADRGLLARSGVDAREIEALNASSDLSEARALLINYQSQIDTVASDLVALGPAHALASATSDQAIAGVLGRQIQNSIASQAVTVSPIAATVETITVATGDAVAAGNTMATLVRKDQPLIAEVYVPTRASGFLTVGQDVRIMYRAFPVERFGVAHGQIYSISNSMLYPDEIKSRAASGQEPVFRVRVSLREQYVAAYNRKFPLRPGMLLRADIIVARKTPIQWLLDPLYAAARRH